MLKMNCIRIVLLSLVVIISVQLNIIGQDSELVCFELVFENNGEDNHWEGEIHFAEMDGSEFLYANINKSWQEDAGVELNSLAVKWHGQSVTNKAPDWAISNNEQTPGYSEDKNYYPFKPLKILVNVRFSGSYVINMQSNHDDLSFDLSEINIGESMDVNEGRIIINRVVPGLKLTTSRYIADRCRYHGYPATASVSDGSTYIIYSTYNEGVSPWRYHNYKDILPDNFDYLAQAADGDNIQVMIEKDGLILDEFPLTSKGRDIFDIAAVSDDDDNVWIAWSEHVDDNQDIYYMKLSGNNPGQIQRLTDAEGPDIHPSLIYSEGRIWITWQGFREGSYDILYTKLSENSEKERVKTVGKTSANEWKPSIAADSKGNISIAWDTYQKGDYDVYYAILNKEGKVIKESPAAASLQFEARPSLVFDKDDRLWIAYEFAGRNWGKDYGAPYFMEKEEGEGLFQQRSLRVICVDKDQCYSTKTPVEAVIPKELRYSFFYDIAAKPASFETGNTPNHYLSSPVLFLDKNGNIGLVYRKQSDKKVPKGSITQWETCFMVFDGKEWSKPVMLFGSYGQMHEEPAVSISKDGEIKVVHASDRMGDCELKDPDQFCQNIWISYPGKGRDHQKLKLKKIPEPVAEEKSESAIKEEKAVAAIRNYTTMADGKTYRILRGDTHRHSAFSGDGGHDSRIEDSHRYALDAAALEWFNNGDHDNGYNEYYWNLTQKYTDIFHYKGYHTPMFGYERSTGFPDGHRNVIFARRGIRVLPRVRYDKNIFRESSPDVELLYRYLEQFDGICISHTSATTTAGTDWRSLNTKSEPVIEIYQGERMSAECDSCPRFDASIPYHPVNKYGFYRVALDKGHHLGIISSSDHKSTHMSYAMVYAEEFTREGIMEGLQKRHTYGATDNIILDVKMNGHMMGEVFKADKRNLDVHVIGTDNIKEIVLVKDGIEYPLEFAGGKEVKLSWNDDQIKEGESYYYIRVMQEDGELAWSSPIWCSPKSN